MKYVLLAVLSCTATGLLILYGVQMYYHKKTGDEVRVQHLQNLQKTVVKSGVNLALRPIKDEIKENKKQSQSYNKIAHEQNKLRPHSPRIDHQDLLQAIYKTFQEDEQQIARDVRIQKNMVRTITTGGLKVS